MMKKYLNINVNVNDLSINILDMLVGCLLGDAHIGRSVDKAFITFEQTIKQEAYVLYIYQALKEAGIDLHEVKYYTREDSRYNSVNKSVYFKTHNSDLFSPLADIFLSKDNNKILPLDIKNLLNPIALAHWICDDGQQVKNGGITLCTDNYSLAEVELLKGALQDRYNLKCSIHLKKSKTDRIYYRIYIGKNSFDNIKPLIIPYIHKSFLYKLNI